jgi:hypothetical protein
MNVIRCPNCDKELIDEEYQGHTCEKVQRAIENVKTLYYSSFIPLKINGNDVAILISEDGKTLYNIKPSDESFQKKNRRGLPSSTRLCIYTLYIPIESSVTKCHRQRRS